MPSCGRTKSARIFRVSRLTPNLSRTRRRHARQQDLYVRVLMVLRCCVDLVFVRDGRGSSFPALGVDSVSGRRVRATFDAVRSARYAIRLQAHHGRKTWADRRGHCIFVFLVYLCGRLQKHKQSTKGLRFCIRGCSGSGPGTSGSVPGTSAARPRPEGRKSAVPLRSARLPPLRSARRIPALSCAACS